MSIKLHKKRTEHSADIVVGSGFKNKQASSPGNTLRHKLSQSKSWFMNLPRLKKGGVIGASLALLLVLVGVGIIISRPSTQQAKKPQTTTPVENTSPKQTVRKVPTEQSLAEDAVTAKQEYEKVKTNPAEVKAKHESLVNAYAADNDCSKVIATTTEFSSLQLSQMEYNTLNFVYTCYLLKNDAEGVKRSIAAQIEIIKAKIDTAYAPEQKELMLQTLRAKEAELRGYR